MEQTNNNQKKTAAERYAYVNEGDAFAQLWQQAEQGDLKAQKEVAYRIYLYVQECSDPLADCETMIRYLKNLAAHGDDHAMFVLGETYYCGYEGVGLGKQDLNESIRWFKLAAEHGNVLAQEWMAEAYFEGHFIDGEPFTEGFDDAPAWLFKLPMERRMDALLDEDCYETVIEWFKKAAKQGNADAQCSLGEMCSHSDCMELDYEKGPQMALKWYKMAANLGHAVAQHRLGLYYFDNYHKKKNEAEALRWFTLSAQQDYPPAQVNLGIYYCYGLIVKQDCWKAIELFKKAAAKGEERAAHWLGCAYADGVEDYKEAAKWYRKAAKMDYWFACYRLGTFYRDGKGVEQSDTEANKWFRRANRLNPSL